MADVADRRRSASDRGAFAGLAVRSWYSTGDWDDDLLSGDEGPDCPPHTVPEPISMVLLGSGLLGIGGVRLRRRRK